MRDEFDHPRLGQALKARVPATSVPAAVDRQILAGARVHLARRSWRRWIAAAATIVVGGSVALVMLPGRTTPQQAQNTASLSTRTSADDINADGRTDILDALALARRGDAPAARIDAIAVAAVRLEGAP
jgi:hypothetical protein